MAIAAGGRYIASFPHARGALAPTAPVNVSHGVPAAVIDGDSLRLGHIDVRLDGIDAPELRQTCHDRQGRSWWCGRAARERLTAIIAGRNVACTTRGHDRYRRTLAVCAAGDVHDLGAAMVREGYAVNYSRYTSRYRALEAQARAAKRGIWQGRFEPPEDWRAGNRRREAARY